MLSLLWLLPVTLALGIGGVILFDWAVRSGQYEDLEAEAYRILDDGPPGGTRGLLQPKAGGGDPAAGVPGPHGHVPGPRPGQAE